MTSPRTRLLAASCAGLLAAGLVTATASSAQAAPTYDGLNGPRGLSIGNSGKTVVAQADGTISRIFRRSGNVRRIAKLPAEFIAPAVAVSPDNAVWALTVGGESRTAGKLYLVKPGKNRHLVANISRWAKNHPDPFDLENRPGASNPYGLAAGPRGSVLVADAEANAVIQVWRSGKIRQIARVKPRTINVPEEMQGGEEPLPPRMPSEAVTTSVAMGPDGSVYIGELRGFPGVPGTSQIWRVKPGAHHAVCKPNRPNKGACKRHAGGFTSIVGLDTGPRGSVYVVELSKAGWLAAESQQPGTEIGSVIRVGRDTNVRHELAKGKVVLPGGVAVTRGGRVFVSGPIFGPGAVNRLN